MSTEIKYSGRYYKRGFRDFIPQQQAEQLEVYKKFILVDGKIKIMRSYNPKHMSPRGGGSYYMDENEDMYALAQQYCTNPQEADGWTFYYPTQREGNFTLWTGYSFKQGAPDNYGHVTKFVTDDELREFVNCHVNQETEEVTNAGKRYWGHNPYTGEYMKLMSFGYNSNDGSLAEGSFSYEAFGETWKGIRLDDFDTDPEVREYFKIEEHPFYQNAFPLLPPGGVI